MPKYKLKLEKYTLPDAVKKFYNQEKLSQAKTERDKVRIKIEEIDSKIESIRNDQIKDPKVKAEEINITCSGNSNGDVKATLDSGATGYSSFFESVYEKTVY